jgi:hypothetical protein
MPGSRPGKTRWVTSRVPRRHARACPGLTGASRRDGGEISREALTDLIAGPRLLDARLKAGQDALGHPAGPASSCTGLTWLDPCIPARWRRDKPRRSDWISSPDLASWMPGSRPGKTRWVAPAGPASSCTGLTRASRRDVGETSREGQTGSHRRILPPGCPAQGRTRRVGSPPRVLHHHARA